MEMKKCPFCGKDNLAYVVMCGYCGERFRTGEKALTTFFALTESELRELSPAPNPSAAQARAFAREPQKRAAARESSVSAWERKKVFSVNSILPFIFGLLPVFCCLFPPACFAAVYLNKSIPEVGETACYIMTVDIALLVTVIISFRNTEKTKKRGEWLMKRVILIIMVIFICVSAVVLTYLLKL